MCNASKKTSRCNQIAKIHIVIYYYISHSSVRNVFTTLGLTWHFRLLWHVKSILMSIQALQHIDKCNKLYQVPIFLGTLWNWKFYKSRKLLMELHWRFSNPRKTIQPDVSCKIMNGTTLDLNQEIELDQNPTNLTTFTKHPMNGWPKNVPKMKTVYHKHPTHGYDQHDDQPTYPKLRPCTRNIQLMDIYGRTRRSIVQLHVCLELGSVEWIVQLNDVQLQTWTWSLQKIAPKTKKR
jgi:hypothetical protein